MSHLYCFTAVRRKITHGESRILPRKYQEWPQKPLNLRKITNIIQIVKHERNNQREGYRLIYPALRIEQAPGRSIGKFLM